jgi:methyl-accepting chemotaxis protein
MDLKIGDTEEYNAAEYDYPHWDWYKIGQNSKLPFVYTDPYYEDTTKVTIVTTSVPFYDKEKKFLGIVIGDINLTGLQKLAQDTEVGNSGWAFLLDTKGNYVTNPDAQKIMKLSIDKDPNSSLSAVASTILSQPSGQVSYKDDKGSNRLYFKKLPETGWVLAMVMPRKSFKSR